jgi:predicted Zn-dependent peptidase
MRDAGMVAALAIANQGVAADSMNRELRSQMALATESLTPGELDKAKNAWCAGTILGRQQAIAVSDAVHYAAMFLGSPDAVNREATRYANVSLMDLRRVARTYLRPENSLTLIIVPEGN